MFDVVVVIVVGLIETTVEAACQVRVRVTSCDHGTSTKYVV